MFVLAGCLYIDLYRFVDAHSCIACYVHVGLIDRVLIPCVACLHCTGFNAPCAPARAQIWERPVPGVCTGTLPTSRGPAKPHDHELATGLGAASRKEAQASVIPSAITRARGACHFLEGACSARPKNGLRARVGVDKRGRPGVVP